MKHQIKYGWVKDTVDSRDVTYRVTRTQPIGTTTNRTRYKMPGIFDQLQLGSCTGNGIAAVIYFLLINGHFQTAAKITFKAFSRLFIYYNERVLENTVNEDAGAQIRDGIKVVAKYGVPPETAWTYNVNKFAQKPSAAAYKKALLFEALQYSRIDNTNLQQMVNCLQSGFPIVFGFRVFDSFESDAVAKSGIVPMPAKGEKELGGHCVWMIDYDLDKKGFWCVNSWGDGWGLKGLFFMPQAYITSSQLADDFWTIQLIK
jgi:C1A family cysteine protease